MKILTLVDICNFRYLTNFDFNDRSIVNKLNKY